MMPPPTQVAKSLGTVRAFRHHRVVELVRYEGVRADENVAAIIAAIELSGATILKAADPHIAPFEFVVRAPNGERLEIVCYAFTANKYKQRKRPDGEHRFQVKYGSDFKNAHTIYFDPERRRVTLMFGVHHELGVFIAVDPLMHSPTWFSRSVAAKEHLLL